MSDNEVWVPGMPLPDNDSLESTESGDFDLTVGRWTLNCGLCDYWNDHDMPAMARHLGDHAVDYRQRHADLIAGLTAATKRPLSGDQWERLVLELIEHGQE